MKHLLLIALLAVVLSISAVGSVNAEDECTCGVDPETGFCLPCPDESELILSFNQTEETECACGQDTDTGECLPCPDESLFQANEEELCTCGTDPETGECLPCTEE